VEFARQVIWRTTVLESGFLLIYTWTFMLRDHRVVLEFRPAFVLHCGETHSEEVRYAC
jgi:hypothetical protein